MRAKWLVAALVVAVVLGALVELSCVASERSVVPRAARESLFTDALEPELPIAFELEQSSPSASPALTR